MINLCLEVPPAPIYKGAREEEVASQEEAHQGGVLLPLGVGFLLFLVGVGIPPWERTMRPAGPLLPFFIYGGGGHPIDTQVDS